MSLPYSDFPQSDDFRSKESASPLGAGSTASYSSIEAKPLTITLDECDRHLALEDLSVAKRTHWLCLKTRTLNRQGQRLRAIACAEEAIALQPDCVEAYAYYAQAHEELGDDQTALAAYKQASQRLSSDHSPLAARRRIWLLNRQGGVYRNLGRYKEAIACYESSLALEPNHAETLSHLGVVLAVSGQRQTALNYCEAAVQLAPDLSLAYNNLGIALIVNRRKEAALAAFDRALELHPTFNKAFYNRAIALSMLGRDQEAAESVLKALAAPSDRHEPWVANAWKLLAYSHLKRGRFADAIESCEQAQTLQPQQYAAALYKLVSLVASGRLLKRLSKADSRRSLAHDVGVVISGIKFRLLAIAAVLGLLLFGEGSVIETLRAWIPTFFSIGIIVLIALDLWFNKSKLRFVWQIYFKSGVLIYVRAIAIVVATLSTFTGAVQIAPRFMLWGWANWVFGQPGNIIFQPLNLINQLNQRQLGDMFAGVTQFWGDWAEDLLTVLHPSRWGFDALAALPAKALADPSIGPITAAHATILLNATTLFVLVFWIMLLLGIPFWARLEERIFRQGAHSWRKICVRSTQFGLVHLLAGIPLLGGFVLIVPGFLFACRYKYVRDRHFRRHGDPQRADEAGVMASTADHAAYNAILVTLVVLTLLVTRG